MSKQYYVYILASRRNGTLYVGVTNNLGERLEQHLHGDPNSFTARYKVHMLVWFEVHSDVNEAIRREKQIKKWRRKWKLELIEASNPDWLPLVPW